MNSFMNNESGNKHSYLSNRKQISFFNKHSFYLLSFFILLSAYANHAFAQHPTIIEPAQGMNFRPGDNILVRWNNSDYDQGDAPDYNHITFSVASTNGQWYTKTNTKAADFWGDIDRNTTFTVPCDAIGPYTIVVEEEWDEFIGGKKRFYSVPNTGTVLFEFPQPQVQVICSYSTNQQTVIFDDPHDVFDQLLLYGSPQAIFPDYTLNAQTGANGHKYFALTKVFLTSQTWYGKYSGGSFCQTNTPYDRVPFVVAVVPTNIVALPDTIPQIVIDDESNTCGSNAAPGTYYDLGLDMADINKTIGDAFKTGPTDTGAIHLSPVFLGGWKCMDCSSGDKGYTAVEVAGTGTTHAIADRVCASVNLPPGKGTSHVYFYQDTMIVHIELYDKNHNPVGTRDLTCALTLRKIKVSKSLAPPVPDIIPVCNEGRQTICPIPQNGYKGARWYDQFHHYVQGYIPPPPPPVGNPSVDYLIRSLYVALHNASTNNGFCLTKTYKYADNFNGKNNYWVSYVTDDNRETATSPINFLVMPPKDTLQEGPYFVQNPNFVNNSYQPDDGAYCDSPTRSASYHDLEFAPYSDTILLHTAISQVNNNNPYAKISYTAGGSYWYTNTDSAGFEHKKIKNAATGQSVDVDRVCYYNLPPGGGTSADYFKANYIRFKVQSFNPATQDTLPPKYSTCDLVDRKVTVSKIIYPHDPKVFILCQPGNATVCLDVFLEQYKTIYWYDNPNDFQSLQKKDHPPHQGYCWTQDWSFYPSKPIQFYWVSQVSKKGDIGPPSPIEIIVLPSPPAYTHDQRSLVKPLAADTDDFNAYCTGNSPQPGSFTDLDDDEAGLQLYLKTMNDLVDTINAHTSFQTQASASPNTYWEPNDSISHPLLTPTINRVCYGNLPDGSPSQTVYREYMNPDFHVHFDPNKIPHVSTEFPGIDEASTICTDLHIRDIVVQKAVVPNPPAGDPFCKPDFSSPTVALLYGDCTGQVDELIACPDGQYTIGPSSPAPTTADYTEHYSWSPTSGLDNPTHKNPKLSYNGIPIPAGNYFKYRLTIKYTPNTSQTPPRPDDIYCLIGYKCTACSAARPAGDDTDETALAVHRANDPLPLKEPGMNLYPNPASERLDIQYRLKEQAPGHIQITDMLGRTLGEYVLESNPSGVLRLHVKAYPAGTYICRLYTETGLQDIQRFIIIK